MGCGFLEVVSSTLKKGLCMCVCMWDVGVFVCLCVCP